MNADCRIDIGAEPFFLTLREGTLADLARGQHLLRSVAFSVSGTEEAWLRHWQKIPDPGWHDLFALLRRGDVAFEGDQRVLMAYLLYVKLLLATPRRLAR